MAAADPAAGLAAEECEASVSPVALSVLLSATGDAWRAMSAAERAERVERGRCCASLLACVCVRSARASGSGPQLVVLAVRVLD